MAEHVWKNKVLFAVLSVYGNEKRLQELDENLQSHDFPRPMRWMEEKLGPGSTIRQRATAICRSHYELTRWFCTQWLPAHPGHHLMVLEDDCLFLTVDAAETLWNQLSYLEQHFQSRWALLMVGQCALGPLWPVRSGLWRTSFPYAAHSYILNRERVAELMNRVPQSKWRRPFMIEGWLNVPLAEKFALSPPLTTQSVKPKEMMAVPLIREFRLETGIQVMETFMKVAALVLIVVVLYLVTFSCRSLARHSSQGNRRRLNGSEHLDNTRPFLIAQHTVADRERHVEYVGSPRHAYRDS